MIKKVPFLMFLGLLLNTPFFAQIQDCDGIRYVSDVFTTATKTTVQFGTNTNNVGTPINLKMDIYTPDGDTFGSRPLLIFAHGGSFITGVRGDMDAWCRQFAKKGYVTATIDYRLWPFFTLGFPDSLKIMDVVCKSIGDFKCAVRWFRENAAGPNAYKIDPNRILIGGYSAGAVAALHTAQLGTDDAIPAFIQTAIDANGGLEGTTGTPSNLAQSSDVRAVVSFSGGLYKKEWVDADDKPFISYHGQVDDVVNFIFGTAAGIMTLNGSGNLHPVATSVGVANYLKAVPTGNHSNLHFDAAFAAHRNEFYSNGCQFLLDEVLCNSVGVQDEISQFSEKSSLLAWPNPAADALEIQLPEAAENWSVEVADLLGRQVFSLKNQSGSLILHKKDIGAAGLFVVSASLPDGQRLTKRVVFE